MANIVTGLVKAAFVTPTLLSTIGGGLTGALVGGGIGDMQRTGMERLRGTNKEKALLGALIGALAGGGLGWVTGSATDNLLDRITGKGPGSTYRALKGTKYEKAYADAMKEEEGK